MKKINFAFGIHSHQPVGNFDFVFDDAFKHAYQPFLDIIEEFPDFKLNVHYSGILWEWIERHYPEHISQMQKLTKRGQVEMLSGGFYEPILPVIPTEDAVGQIRKLSTWIQQQFGQTPRGMWLAERVWEPSVPSLMHDAGIAYTVIDDAHFRYAGLQGDELWGYYTTEDNGKLVYIFPISQKLRYTIPFQPPEATLEFLRELATEDGERLIVFADDGEKFGVWPGTYSHVYEHQWLREFLNLITRNQNWIHLVHFSEAIASIKPAGRIYLPTASYAEMMQWALPAAAFQEYEDFEHYLKNQGLYERFRVFVRGGFWRNFLSKYPEANNMHKKMLYVSQLVHEAISKGEIAASDATPVLENLWAGQCNCPYWHGVFGGLYLGHIRHAVYQELLKAENGLRKLVGKAGSGEIHIMDFDKDGMDEVLMETPFLNLYFNPEKGGHLFELDYLPSNYNLLNTMTRRKEGYHKKLIDFAHAQNEHSKNSGSGSEVASIHDLVTVKEKGLEKYLNYDTYERKSLIDHIFPAGISLDAFASAGYQEMGDFFNHPYRVVEATAGSGSSQVILQREGTVEGSSGKIPLQLTKTIRALHAEPIIEIEYSLQAQSDVRADFLLGIEFNFSMLAGNAPDRYYYSRKRELKPANLSSRGEIREGVHLGIMDKYHNFQIDLEPSRPSTIWYLPVETISLSEAGFERVYQNSTILFIFPIELKQPWQVKIQKMITNIH